MRYRSFPTRESATAESKEMLRRLNPAVRSSVLSQRMTVRFLAER